MFELGFHLTASFLDPVLVVILCAIGGFIASFLGIGYGVVITPLLMGLGLQPLLAVSTQLCHSVGIYLSNFLSYKRRQDVDFQIAFYLLLGGFFGAVCEWAILKYSSGSSLALHKFTYVYISTLFIFGITMMFQVVKALKKRSTNRRVYSVMMRRWMLYLPFHKIFIRSRTEMSIFVPIFVGFLAGLIVATIGGGDNLFMTPLITYLIGRSSPIVQGTNALVGCLISAMVTIVYSLMGYHCDFFLACLVLFGTSIGSIFGIRLTYKLKRHVINFIAAVFVFILAGRMLLFGPLRIATTAATDTINVKTMTENAIFHFAHNNPVLYTAACILLICIFAFVIDKILHNVFEKKPDQKASSKKK